MRQQQQHRQRANKQILPVLVRVKAASTCGMVIDVDIMHSLYEFVDMVELILPTGAKEARAQAW